ncbi:MAG: hypothetical protein HeimC3_53960 [Candidatus Heimdallarchaeota archaeon LC_3]|nr:MAG: hypothetical protein HeimC3_53960 [Candidatus Heimdallarchaeota archaeon LC_3]
MKNFQKKRGFYLFLTFLTIFSSSIMNSQLNPTLGETAPLIYTESEEIVFTQGSSTKIVWIVIDNDPKKYWITNTFDNNETYLQSERPFTISKIEIKPVGIPIGNNIIRLYVEDFSKFVSISDVEVIVFPSSPTTIATAITSSSEEPPADSAGATGIFFSIPAFIGIVFLRLIRKKTKRREDEK